MSSISGQHNTHTVTIAPEMAQVTVPDGTSALIAAHMAGFDIESPCGGRGTCGKCAVRVLEGGSRCVMPDESRSWIPDELRAQGYVPACGLSVKGDITIEIPKFSKLAKHKVVLESKSAESHFHGVRQQGQEWEAARNDDTVREQVRERYAGPFCRRYRIKLHEPSLTSNLSDLQRLYAGLSREYGLNSLNNLNSLNGLNSVNCLNDLDISLSCLRKLPGLLRESGWDINVTVASYGYKDIIIALEPASSIPPPCYGLAVDIGTTTVAAVLLDTATGTAVGTAGAYNRQSVYGSDVISRIVYSDEEEQGPEKLQNAVIETINSLIGELAEKHSIDPEEISAVVCAGNTVMTHLFMKVPATWLRLEPYIPGATDFPPVPAGEIGLRANPDAPVIVLPSVASYVGGDITAGVLATGLDKINGLTLFIDIGTNGELVLGNGEWLVSCSCSAGPAFEGSGISCGMRAMDGAIESVDIDADTLEAVCRTIGDAKPLGICGSGLIYLLSEMIGAGVIDRAGKINEGRQCRRIRNTGGEAEYALVFAEESGTGADITVTGSDIKNLLRAKGAIFAGIRTMLEQMQMKLEDIRHIYIAGGFGRYINVTDAINIGLLPDLPTDRFEYAGNSSLQGAATVLMRRDAFDEARRIAGSMTYLELSVGNMFMDEFVSALFIPHTDLTLFPSFRKGVVA